MNPQALAAITAAFHNPARGRGARRAAAVTAFVNLHGHTTAKDIALATGFPDYLASTYLSRARKEGRITRLSPGVYAPAQPTSEHSRATTAREFTPRGTADHAELTALADGLLALALDGRWPDVAELTDDPLLVEVLKEATTVLLRGISSRLTGLGQYDAPIDTEHLAAHMRGWSLEHLRYALNERNPE